MATARAMDHDDILFDQPEGTIEEHGNGRYLFRWKNITWQIRPVKDDPDSWIIKGTGGEYRCEPGIGSCTCKGNAHHHRCKHADDVMPAFLERRGATRCEDEEAMSEDELKALFA